MVGIKEAEVAVIVSALAEFDQYVLFYQDVRFVHGHE
jgi:hypothetical protein